MPLPLPLPPLPDDTSPFSAPCGRGVRPEPLCPPVLPSGGAVPVLPAALRIPLRSVLCRKQINTSKFCKECELTLRLGEWRAARDAALDRYGTDYATMRKIEAETFRARKGENQTRRGEAYQQALTMLGDEEDFKYRPPKRKASGASGAAHGGATPARDRPTAEEVSPAARLAAEAGLAGPRVEPPQRYARAGPGFYRGLPTSAQGGCPRGQCLSGDGGQG